MRTATILFVLSLSAPALSQVVMDAAEVDRFGESLETACVRPIVDNSAGATDMTDVRFRIDSTSILGHIEAYLWSDSENPWFGAPGGAEGVSRLHDGKEYVQGWVYYPPTKEWAPAFSVDPTPGVPNDPLYPDSYILLDTVPAGLCWDLCFRLMGLEGEPIRVFASPARGVFEADGGETVVYDNDPMPQTVPEPIGLILFGLGSVCILRRRRRQ